MDQMDALVQRCVQSCKMMLVAFCVPTLSVALHGGPDIPHTRPRAPPPANITKPSQFFDYYLHGPCQSRSQPHALGPAPSRRELCPHGCRIPWQLGFPAQHLDHLLRLILPEGVLGPAKANLADRDAQLLQGEWGGGGGADGMGRSGGRVRRCGSGCGRKFLNFVTFMCTVLLLITCERKNLRGSAKGHFQSSKP